MTLSTYVHQHVTALIDAVEVQSHKAASDTSDAGIHDLRVAIRRLSENLRVFADTFPPGAAKTVRKHLRIGMHAAGVARNHDIAHTLMNKAKIPIPPYIPEQREQSAAKLGLLISTWNEGAAFRAWKEQLHV